MEINGLTEASSLAARRSFHPTLEPDQWRIIAVFVQAAQWAHLDANELLGGCPPVGIPRQQVVGSQKTPGADMVISSQQCQEHDVLG